MVATAIIKVAGAIIVVGLPWIALYYGGILPIYNFETATYGSNIFDSTTITFILAVCAFWTFILTLAFIFYMFQQSQKPEVF